MSEVVIFAVDFELGTRIADIAAAQGKSTAFPDHTGHVSQEILGDAELLIIDLGQEQSYWKDVIRHVREQFPGITIVGYASRIQKFLHDEARKAGCTWVLPKSSVVKNIPRLLEKEW